MGCGRLLGRQRHGQRGGEHRGGVRSPVRALIRPQPEVIRALVFEGTPCLRGTAGGTAGFGPTRALEIVGCVSETEAQSCDERLQREENG